MLRAGLSLPQRTHNPLQYLYTILPCNPSSRVFLVSQVRRVSHSAVTRRSTHESDATQDFRDELEPAVTSKKTGDPHWKSTFIREIKIRGAARRTGTRPSFVTHEPQPNSTGNHSDKRIPGIVIHPVHRPSYRKRVRSVAELSGQRPVPCKRLLKAFSRPSLSEKRPSSQIRDALLQTIVSTHSVPEAWEAYSTLLTAPNKYYHALSHAARSSRLELEYKSSDHAIPHSHLHCLARLLACTHPRTRQLFLRLLSVLTTLRTTGGHIFAWEWNALIDCAGKGWRKTRIEDYRAAVGIFEDMVTSGRTTSSLPSAQPSPFERKATLPVHKTPVARPDIITFTTLLDIASRTLADNAILHAISLLEASGLPWNNVTHMARLPYFIHTNQLHAVRGILSIGVTRGLDLITLNGCLWAYAYKGRLRIVMQVYDLLRRNIPAEDRADSRQNEPPSFSLDPQSHVANSDQDGNPFFCTPGFIEQATMAPDSVTYTLLIQALCYHGDLIAALTVFRDMVSTVDPASRLKLGKDAKPIRYKPTSPIYRAIFLGFARHANKKSTLGGSLITMQQRIDAVPLPEFAARLTARYGNAATTPSPIPEVLVMETPWTLENLERIFERFLEVDWEAKGVSETGEVMSSPRPSDRMIYWILVAYAKTTKRDVRKMCNVWKQLDARFGYGSVGLKLGGRLGRIERELESHGGWWKE